MAESVPAERFSASDFPDIQWFDETISHPAIEVPAKHVAHRKKQLKNIMLHEGKNVYVVPPIESERDYGCDVSSEKALPQRRVLILNVGVTFDDVVSSTRGEEQMNNNNNENDLVWIDSFPITRGYYDMSVDEVLRKLLAKYQVNEIPSGFELVGHIAHVNLRDDCLPYKYWIGRVILDLNQPTIKTVVNKIGIIETDNVFRTFKQEVIAGNNAEPDWSITTVYEHGCSFQLDFRNVYWNSRLSGEHRRLVQLIKNSYSQQLEQTDCNPNTMNEKQHFVVVDLMAGVGPFAIPLTTPEQMIISKNSRHPPVTSNMTVYANDLNPDSVKFLEINKKKNKCSNLYCSNLDARDLIKDLQLKMVSIDHVIMNLPASATEYLDAFRGWKTEKLPLIHVYCFSLKCTDDVTTNQVIINRCSEILGCSIEQYNIYTVRNISPTKNMYCVSFHLPEAARYLKKHSAETQLRDKNAKREKNFQPEAATSHGTN